MKNKNKVILALSLSFLGSVLVTACDLYGSNEKYTIEFVSNGGSTVEKLELDWNSEIVLPANPTRAGYSFAGWFTDEACTVPFTLEGTKINQNAKLYAKWTINQYTVSFNTGNGTAVAAITGNYNTKVTPANPTLEGYSFAGWYLDTNYQNSWNSYIPSSDITVYAKWTGNTVTFKFYANATDAQGDMANQKIQTSAEGKATKLTTNAYTRTGYTFGGWSKTENGEKAYNDQAEIPAIIDETLAGKTINLYAIWNPIKYDVTFSVGNEQVSKKELAYGSQIELPQTEPEKDGYTFNGWGTYQKTTDTKFDASKVYYTNEGSETEPAYQVAVVTENATIEGNYYEIVPYTENVVPLNGINLFASFTKEAYIVTYVTEGDDEIPNATCFYGSTINLPTPVKTGYTFGGWYTDEARTQLCLSNASMPAHSVKLYAKWTANQYTIEFIENGGSEVANITAAYRSAIEEPASPTKTGYHFAGWYTDEDLTESFGFSNMPLNGAKLYADWAPNTDTAYTVKHLKESLSGNYELDDTDNLTGTTAADTEAVANEYTGFEAGTITQVKIAADGSTVIEIKYQRKEYTVTFVDADDPDTVLKTVTVKYEKTIGEIPTDLHTEGNREEFTYNGSSTFSGSTVINENITVTVKHIAVGLGIIFTDQSCADITDVEEGDAITAPTNPTKEGYTFAGWLDNNGAAYTIPAVMPDHTIELHANWLPNLYTFEFDSNGGSTVADITQNYGTALTAPTDPTRTGYTFKGWFTDDDTFANEYSFGSTMPSLGDNSAKLTLHAKWEINSYTIEFVENGGSDVANITANYDTEVTAPTNPTKTGYTFDGWYTDEACTVAFTFDKMPLNGAKLYAKWNVNTYRIAFETNGGTSVTTREADFGGSFEAVANPTKEADNTYMYTFAGWFTDAECTQTYVIPSTMPATDNDTNTLTLYAKWNASSYTVKFMNRAGGEAIYTRAADGTEPNFEEYSYDLYRDTVTYQFINTALNDVVEYSATEGASGSLVGYGIIQAYFGCLKNGYPAATDVTTFKTYVYNASSGQINLDQIDTYVAPGTSTTAFYALQRFSYTTDSVYIDAVFNFQTAQEAPAAETSSRLLAAISAYNNYYANAYMPYKEGAQFDGWTITYDYNDGIKYYNAKWATKADTPVNVIVDEIKSTSVTFSWDAVDKAGAYIVSYIINPSDENTAWTDAEVSKELTSYQITGLSNGDTVKFKVQATGQDGEGNKRTESSGLTFTSYAELPAADPVAAISLVSDYSKTVTYNHVTTAEADITGAGDYFYVDSNNNLYLFTSTGYSFKDVKYIEVNSSTCSASVEYDTDSSKYKLHTGATSGSVVFDIYKQASGVAAADTSYYSISGTNGELNRTVSEVTNVVVGTTDVSSYYTKDARTAYVKVLPDSIDYSDEIKEYNTNISTIASQASTTEAKEKLYQNTDVTAYQVGYATTGSNNNYADYSGYEEDSTTYNNGVNFGFVVNSQNGTKLDSSMFDLEYKVQGLNGSSEWVDLTSDDVFVLDEENGVIYFKNVRYYLNDGTPVIVNSGNTNYETASNKFRLVVSPKSDKAATINTDAYVNLSLPKAYKDSSKIASVTFEFELTNSINVYSNESLKKAYADSDVKGIALHSDIEAKLSTKQIGYIDYMVLKGFEDEGSVGELDIVDGSAIMCTSTTYGPKVWKQTESKREDVFCFRAQDENGEYHYYYYAENGDYVIKSAEWTTNYDEGGKFKIVNETQGKTTAAKNANLEIGNIYSRNHYSGSVEEDIVINGNYYTVDGSKLPFIVSTNHVSVSGTIAAYEIQAVNIAIFGNYAEATATFNNLTIVSNTKDASSFLNGDSGNESSIAEYMARTSGGFNGIRSSSYDSFSWGSSANNNPADGQSMEDKAAQVSASVAAGDSDCTTILNNVNVYNSLIALYVDYRSNMTANYCHVKQTWANTMYAHGGDDLTVSNSCVETSGGASYHVEDVIYVKTDENGNATGLSPINPQLAVEYTNTFSENYISGEEQWFKAYSMEVLALGMKSKINSAVSAMGYTVIQNVIDPNTGLETEKMNLVYMSKNEAISLSATYRDANVDDLDPDIVFGTAIASENLSAQEAGTIAYLKANQKLDFTLYQGASGTKSYVATMDIDTDKKVYVVLSYDTTVSHQYLYFTYNMGSYSLAVMIELHSLS